MLQTIETLRREFLSDLNQIKTSADIESLKVKFLGKKGPIQQLMKNLKDLSSEERPQAGKVINEVRAACDHVLALPGNLDTAEVIPFLEREGVALHGRGVVIDGVAIFGCGGSNITPFKTPTELNEDEIYETLVRGYAEVRETRPQLMVCHTPPFETRCDRIAGGRAVGSTAARPVFDPDFDPKFDPRPGRSSKER